jgi:hypothetical protein
VPLIRDDDVPGIDIKHKHLIVFPVAIVAALVAYCVWRNTPQQRGVRFLNELSAVSSVRDSDSGLARKGRVLKLLNLLSDPIVVEVEAAGVKRIATHDEVSTAYLVLLSESTFLSLEFDDIAVIASSSSHIRLNAQLTTACDISDGRYSVNSPVTINLAKGDDGLKLSRIIDESTLEN